MKPGLNTPGVTNHGSSIGPQQSRLQTDPAALKVLVDQRMALMQAELQSSIQLPEKHIQEGDAKEAAAATCGGKVCPCCLPF